MSGWPASSSSWPPARPRRRLRAAPVCGRCLRCQCCRPPHPWPWEPGECTGTRPPGRSCRSGGAGKERRPCRRLQEKRRPLGVLGPANSTLAACISSIKHDCFAFLSGCTLLALVVAILFTSKYRIQVSSHAKPCGKSCGEFTAQKMLCLEIEPHNSHRIYAPKKVC